MRETNIQSIEKRVYELEKKGSGESSADKISYDNSITGLTADNVQSAIDEIHEEVENIKHHYSIDEKIVGEWVDGSIVYEKSYVLDINDSEMIIDNSLTNDNIIPLSIKGFTLMSTGNYIPILYNGSSSLTIFVGNSGLKFDPGYGTNKIKCWLTIRYIKND